MCWLREEENGRDFFYCGRRCFDGRLGRKKNCSPPLALYSASLLAETEPSKAAPCVSHSCSCSCRCEIHCRCSPQSWRTLGAAPAVLSYYFWRCFARQTSLPRVSPYLSTPNLHRRWISAIVGTTSSCRLDSNCPRCLHIHCK